MGRACEAAGFIEGAQPETGSAGRHAGFAESPFVFPGAPEDGSTGMRDVPFCPAPTKIKSSLTRSGLSLDGSGGYKPYRKYVGTAVGARTDAFIPKNFPARFPLFRYMPRRPRVVGPGVARHVTRRGDSRGAVFHSSGDRRCHLDLRAEYSGLWDYAEWREILAAGIAGG